MYLRLSMNYRPRAEIHCSLLILTVGRLHAHNTEDFYSPRLTVDVRVRTPRWNLGSCRAHLIPDWLAFLDKGSLDFFWIYGG